MAHKQKSIKSKLSGFWKKSKSVASSAYKKATPHVKAALEKTKEASKEAYGKAEGAVKRKLHDERKKIALKVIAETKDMVTGKDEKDLAEALSIVSREYARGGNIDSIPRLNKKSTWKDVKNYLLWLRSSPYQYHIDDDPFDIPTFTDDEQIVLKKNSDIMWSFSKDGKRGTNLWEVYNPIVELKGGGKTGTIVKTKDGVQVDIASEENKRHIFYDKDGNKFKCLGYHAKSKDCLFLNLKTKKKYHDCVKGYYYNNPKEMKKGGGIKITPAIQKQIDDLPSGWGSDLANMAANTSEKEQREIMRKIGLTAEEVRKTHPTELKAEPYGALFYIELKKRRVGYRETGGKLKDENFYKEGSNKWGLGKTEIYIIEKEDGSAVVFDSDYDKVKGWHDVEINKSENLSEAKEFALKYAKKQNRYLYSSGGSAGGNNTWEEDINDAIGKLLDVYENYDFESEAGRPMLKKVIDELRVIRYKSKADGIKELEAQANNLGDLQYFGYFSEDGRGVVISALDILNEQIDNPNKKSSGGSMATGGKIENIKLGEELHKKLDGKKAILDSPKVSGINIITSFHYNPHSNLFQFELGGSTIKMTRENIYELVKNGSVKFNFFGNPATLELQEKIGSMATGGELGNRQGIFEITVPKGKESLLSDDNEYEIISLIGHALTKKWFGHGAFDVRLLNKISDRTSAYLITAPRGKESLLSDDNEYDFTELISKTLTKKWFGHGAFDVRRQKKSSGGSMATGGVAGKLHSLTIDELKQLYAHYGLDEEEFDNGKEAVIENLLEKVDKEALENTLMDYSKKKGGGKIDTITMDVPLFIRTLEYAREDAKTDMDLHKVTENATKISKSDKALTMKDYDSIVDVKANGGGIGAHDNKLKFKSGGRGFFGLEKGEKIKSNEDISIGDVLLTHSNQFQSDNVIKITDKYKVGNYTHIHAIYWNPITNKRIGDEEFGVSIGWSNDYYRPIKTKSLNSSMETGGELGDHYDLRIGLGSESMDEKISRAIRDLFIRQNGVLDKKIMDNTISSLSKHLPVYNRVWKSYINNMEIKEENGKYVNPFFKKGGSMETGGISGRLSTTYSNPIEYLKAMGAKIYSDLNYSTEANGINYYVGYKGDKAIVVAFIEDEDKYMITKEDAREMSLTAKTKGINSVELYTNYGIELHSRLEKPKDIGFDKIYKVSVGASMAIGGGINKFKIGEKMEIYPHSQNKGAFTVEGYDDLGGGKFQYIGKFENDKTEYRFLPNSKDKAYSPDGVMATGGQIPFSNSNLYIKGMGLDSNGNSVIRVGFPNDKAFSIQTNGVLKETNNLVHKYKKVEDFTPEEVKIISDEVNDYVKNYGSKNQKERLRIYGK